jgi:carboxyl-terminal processing protease
MLPFKRALPLCGLAFLAGLTLPPAQANLSLQLGVFLETLQVVDTRSIQAPGEARLMEGAIRGLLASLEDPYSSYLTPAEYQQLSAEQGGAYVGLGIEVGMQERQLTVIAAVENSPAWEAGLQPGDQIVAIDQRLTEALSFTEATALLQGDEGTQIELRLQREGKPLTLSLLRRKIDLPAVSSLRLPGNVGYFRIATFLSTEMPLEFQTQLMELQEAAPLEGLILDLRNNPGGLLANAIELGSALITEGPLVRTIDRNRETQVFTATGLPLISPSLPVVVLINEGTASAAEVVAGALQDHQRAQILGRRSFGKGLVQKLLPLQQGAGLTLTTSRYLTAFGREVHQVGIPVDRELRGKGLPTAGATDPWIQAALDALRGVAW